MSRLYKLLLSIVNFYAIFFGLSYTYVNFEKRLVIFYTFLKIYVYFINLIYAAFLLYINIKYPIYELRKTTSFGTMELFMIIENSGRIFALIFLISMRLEKEKFFKKWRKLFSTFQNEYFDKIECITTDKITERIQIFNILLILIHCSYGIWRVILHLYYGGWLEVLEECPFIFFGAMENYIMFHHSLVLSFIAKWFAKLNYQLKNEELHENCINIYLKLDFLLEKVNYMNSKVIFAVLSTQLVQIALYLFLLFQVYIIFHTLNPSDLWIIGLFVMLCINIFL